jgi:hypothetical protein
MFLVAFVKICSYYHLTTLLPSGHVSIPPLIACLPALSFPPLTDCFLFIVLMTQMPRKKAEANVITGGSKGARKQLHRPPDPNYHVTAAPSPFSLSHYRSLIFDKYYDSAEETRNQGYMGARLEWENFVYVESGHLRTIDVDIHVDKVVVLCEVHALLWWARSAGRLRQAGMDAVSADAAAWVADFLKEKFWLWSA